MCPPFSAAHVAHETVRVSGRRAGVPVRARIVPPGLSRQAGRKDGRVGPMRWEDPSDWADDPIGEPGALWAEAGIGAHHLRSGACSPGVGARMQLNSRPLLRLSSWCRIRSGRCEGQAGFGETAVDEVGTVLDVPAGAVLPCGLRA